LAGQCPAAPGIRKRVITNRDLKSSGGGGHVSQLLRHVAFFILKHVALLKSDRKIRGIRQ
jgi:hypothetical protein